MALETGTYLSDLVITNPVSTDGIGQADDHMRLIKKTIKNSFPSVTGAVTASHTELNILDGLTATTAELNKLDGVTATTAELNILDGVTSTAAELNKLDGFTGSVSDLNKLAAVTATATELNKLAGATVTTAEINKLDGFTGNTSDLNILSGASGAGVSAAEFQYINGVTSSIQTQLNSKLNTAGGNVTGTVEFQDNVKCAFGNDVDTEFHHNGTDMYIDVNNGGNLYIRDGNSSDAVRFTFDVDNGNLTVSNDITAFSDRRLKDNIETISDALGLVGQMRGVTYERDGKPSVGVIAQEMQEVLPEVVHLNDNGYLSVAYGNIIGVLIEAIKELRTEVETLKAGG